MRHLCAAGRASPVDCGQSLHARRQIVADNDSEVNLDSLHADSLLYLQRHSADKNAHFLFDRR